ncbi:antioxidant, AhpC/TSA family [Gleimia coleocanis DSM 15436]|uniref:thioredoxin-dependent peroxiredoxin n=1 Tax=Gleimia coleocanis DSM 15436 TaxID=525245 RepID=C0W197_9ACTO|nr:peroxiredoxin [Gleimia coleocanis]EEH63586.1 antioxidant, AhpC/TSA family [Gleimia coleocanis DSM 15436]
MPRFEIGDTVPNFQLPATTGEFDLYQALEASENGVVVYFYPKASTPGCTTEACDFRDSLQSLKSAGYTVVGVSPDKLPALEKFLTNQELNFALASDETRSLMENWGAYGEKQNYGKTVVGVIRSTVIVGKDKQVLHALYNVKAKGHVARIRKLLGID